MTYEHFVEGQCIFSAACAAVLLFLYATRRESREDKERKDREACRKSAERAAQENYYKNLFDEQPDQMTGPMIDELRIRQGWRR